jgi:CRP-like cAMP-binding protein
VLKGAVRAYYIAEDGSEHTVSFGFENSPMAEIENFSRLAPSSVEVMTLEPTELIWIGQPAFFNFLEKFPKYESALRNMMSHFLQIDSEQWRLLRISSARERYETLCKMKPEVIERVPLKYIASYLEMAVETLSRVRAGKL